MRKSIAVTLFAALVALSATQLMAVVIPPAGLAPGSQYQLIFATADMIAPTSGDILTYNTFAAAEATQNPSLPAASWHAVVSTTTTNAIDNAPSPQGVPVYNTQGTEIAASGLYSNSDLVESPIRFDQFGNDVHFFVLSGTASTGLALLPLGTQGPFESGNPSAEVGWIDTGDTFGFDPGPIYVLSSVLTVPAPEPSSIVLGLIAAAGLALVAIRKRRARR